MDRPAQAGSVLDPVLRRRLMAVLARLPRQRLESILAQIAPDVEIHPVRGPETGLVMVRGRIGGGGSPFNLGEATVSRATVRLSTGEIGHGQLLGTDRQHARLAAILDALHQRGDHQGAIAAFITDSEAELAQAERRQAEETAATRVDFFTMVRGDD
ncbi:phosphonate C-P lyase system protein PhnG [Rhizobium sp. RU20A]|uniref:phosphonate C-P lyase system protein PhnG n=1 Tax=Rhizobium sp. RU20A TaxID=1907412 RepID=UPI00122D417C|nr:phosphonate C-P lyase system protein PhnG [Rhizobium sp. RU20A]